MKDIELHKFDHSSFEVNICKTDKFKTINIILLSEFNHNKDLATHIALLGYIFEQGSVNFPSDNNFQVILEELYGAKIATNVTRKKNKHVVMINMEFPNGKYMNQPDLLKKVIKLLRDIFFQPVIYSSEYGEAALEKAKSNLRNKINDIENNIFLKANRKALEYLYNDKKLSTPYGDSEELNQLSLENLKAIHKAMPGISENKLFFIGDVEKAIILEELEEEFKVEIGCKALLKNSSEVKVDDIIESHLEIQEGLGENGVLVLVFKIDKGKDVVNTVINAIFGRFPTSLLFKSVREKENITYFIISHIDKNNDLVIVNIGVDENNVQKSIKTVQEQMEILRNGKISNSDISNAKNMLINMLLNSCDSPMGIVDICLENNDLESKIEIENLMSKINEVTRHEIMLAARKWELALTYYLKSKE